MKNKINILVPVFMEQLPKNKDLEQGIIYITEKYNTSKHLCACGCGGTAVLPINEGSDKSEWDLVKHDDGSVSFYPSIGNWSGQSPYHAHYFIKKNKIVW